MNEVAPDIIVCVYTCKRDRLAEKDFLESALGKFLNEWRRANMYFVEADQFAGKAHVEGNRIILDCVEEYDSLSIKTFEMLAYCVASLKFRLLVKIDVTIISYFCPDSVSGKSGIKLGQSAIISWLNDLRINADYSGVYLHQGVNKQKVEAWAHEKGADVNYDLAIATPFLPPYFSGKCYAVGHDFCKYIVRTGARMADLHMKHLFGSEDSMIGRLYDQFLISREFESLKPVSADLPWKECEADSIVLVSVIRNECLLLPFFLNYYTRLGVTHFIFIDNNSNDGSFNILKNVSGAYIKVYATLNEYRESNYGMDWVNSILNKYCVGKYVVLADADELLYLENLGFNSLRSLICAMKKEGCNVAAADVIDMYPYRLNNSYRSGAPFYRHSKYYDEYSQDFCGEWGSLYGSAVHRVGGMRKRMFGITPCIHKFPVFCFDFLPVQLAPGAHFFALGESIIKACRDIRVFSRRIQLMHYKFIKHNLEDCFSERVSRDQDWNDSEEYVSYLAFLMSRDKRSKPVFFSSKYSRVHPISSKASIWSRLRSLVSRPPNSP